MSSKTVLSIGQCRPDTASINHFLTSNFDAEVITANLPQDSMSALRQQKVDLVLINRKLDADNSDGMEILKQIKSDAELLGIPVMLVSNFSDWQQKAVDEGAIYGFGKSDLQSPDAIQRVREALQIGE